ncbi:MAG: hypothetical protein AB1498_06770 [bacterium]
MKKITVASIIELIIILLFTICGIFAIFSDVILLSMFGFLFALTGVMWFHAVYIKPKYPEDKS